jgi:hypothetical protein
MVMGLYTKNNHAGECQQYATACLLLVSQSVWSQHWHWLLNVGMEEEESRSHY